jgi:general stress protein YciG
MSNKKSEPKPMTVVEAGRKGGKARAKNHSMEQLSEWARKGGWPKGRSRKPKPKEEESE